MEPSTISLFLLSALTLYQQQIIVLSQCFDTKYLKTKYTALSRPDYEILGVTREEYCKTHCSGNSSCAAFVYNTENSTCVLSGEPDVILNGYITDVKNVTVKKRFSSELLVQDDGGPCDESMQFLNARQYYSPRNEYGGTGQNTGTFWSVTYNKTRGDTGIRIIQHNTVRGHYNDPGKCSHWFVQFNGEKCTNPGTIEQLDFSESTGDFHRGSDIDGVCWGLSGGGVLVESVVGPCDGYSITNSRTAWNAPMTTIVMEVIPSSHVNIDAAMSCPKSIAFNYHHHAWDEELDVTHDFSDSSLLVKSVTYSKTSSETGLRIKYSALLSVKMTPNTCGRWFIAVNGTECEPKADASVYWNIWRYWKHHRRFQTIEGICINDLEAGVYSIEVWVGECYLVPVPSNPFTQPTNVISGGFNTSSKLHIQEVRAGNAVDAINEWGSNFFAKVEHSQWYNPWKGEDEGPIFTVTYDKEYSDTGLRLTASGIHRNRRLDSDGYDKCARWYFLIDDQECRKPGSIAAVSYFDIDSSYYYLSMQTSGVCNEITSGSHSIAYAVGRCHGYDPTDAFTGWRSSFHVFIEELRLESVKDCGNSFPINCDN